jgi:hypothetical protein
VASSDGSVGQSERQQLEATLTQEFGALQILNLDQVSPPAHWWEQPLHTQTSLRLKAALLFRPGTVVISVPYHLEQQPR